MLKPVEMQKVRIIALKAIASPLIRDLHELGMVEIRPAQHEGMENGRPLEFYNEVSTELVRMRAIKNTLQKYSEGKFSGALADGDKALREAKSITLDNELNSLQSAIAASEDDLKRLNEGRAAVELLSVFSEINFSMLGGETTSYIAGTFNMQKLEAMKHKLDKMLKHYNVHYVTNGARSIALIVYAKSNVPELETELAQCDFVKIDAPDYLTTPSEAMAKLDGDIASKMAALAEIHGQMREIAARSYAHIALLEKSLSIEADRAEIASRFGATASTYFIEGWLKKEDWKGLEKELSKYGSSMLLEKAHTDHHDEPPVVLKNPGIAHPLEYITKTYSLPNYHDIDPTMLYFITLPLLYGMIVGDVIYGLISIPLALFFLKKFKNSYVMRSVSMMWLYGVIPSIAFGLYFDEWAGTGHFHWAEVLEKWNIHLGIGAPLYQGVSRIHELTSVIGLTLMVGLLHIALGLVLGAIKEWGHSKKHAMAKVSWLGVELGGTLTIMAFMLNALPAMLGNYGLAVLVVSAIGLYLTEGVVGVVEIPGLAGNVLSYLRIAVVGVVGSILAELINEMLLPLPGQGAMAFIFFPLFIALHAMNTFIAMFEAMIQGGRLNILEFKSKFVTGGGKLFEPFALR